MNNAIIAFLFAIAVGVWLYTYLMRTTGSNTKNSLIGSVVAGILVFGVLFYTISLIH